MSQPQSSSTNSNQAQNNQKNLPEIYLPPNITGKKTLVLDLDETLVHSQFGPFDIPSDVVINIEIENEIHDIHVLVRPGVKEFLEKISKKFEIVIFTASISKYAGPLLDILDKNKFCSYRLFREHCTLINTSFVKDLKKLGRDLKDVIIVDNSPMAYLLNNDNGLPILTWFDDKTDRELYKILPILEFLSLVPDVRDYICKMVVNNEISYSSAMNVINDYNEMLRRKQNENSENEKDPNIIENNNEISDSSENNLIFINKNNNGNEKRQQININIINNNITNYIYDNKNQEKKENINVNNNYPNNIQDNNNEKNQFNPNSIIASVNKTNLSPEIPSLSSLISCQKQINKNKNNSMKNITNKDKDKEKLKNNIKIKIGQYNTNKNLHRKSESTGMGYKNKAKKNKVEILNSNNIDNTNNKNIYLNNNTQNLKSNPVRNNTNYSSKSYNKKEIKINPRTSLMQKDNKNTKSSKSLKNGEKPFINNSNNNSNKNISVNKIIYNKNTSKNKYKYEKSQIRLYNEGNMTTVHKKQKSLINFNSLKDKSYRTNNNKKQRGNNGSINLLHSVDFTKNDVATYYHNDNFPIFKKNNINSTNNNINSGGISTKSHNRNKFLKTGKIKSNNNKNIVSSSLDIMPNKNNSDNLINNNVKKYGNNININNNNFNYIKKKNNEKQFLFKHTLKEKEEKQKQKNTDDNKENNNNNDNINQKDHENNNLNENVNNNSVININEHSNDIGSNFDMASSCQRSESMKDLTGNNKEAQNKKYNKNNKKGINNSSAKRPKSSNMFKRTKEINVKKNQMKRNSSGKNGKNVKSIKYDISEILERRGIAKSNRAKDLTTGINYNLSGNYVFNSSNINSSNRNKSKNNAINQVKENIIHIKTKDI